LDPKDDTQTSGGLTGSPVAPMADEPVQVNPDVPSQTTEATQTTPMRGTPKVAPIPKTAPATPFSGGVTSDQPIEPATPTSVGAVNTALSQEETTPAAPDIPIAGSETEEEGTTAASSMTEPVGNAPTDDSDTSGGGVPNL
jgi:hypothetical protein